MESYLIYLNPLVNLLAVSGFIKCAADIIAIFLCPAPPEKKSPRISPRLAYLVFSFTVPIMLPFTPYRLYSLAIFLVFAGVGIYLYRPNPDRFA